MPFLRPSAIICLACSMRSGGMKYGLSLWAASSATPRQNVLAVELGGGLLERHRQRAGREHAADLAAVDHRFQVVELVDLEAAEDHELGVRGTASSGRRTRWRRSCRARRVPSRRHGDAAGVEAAGGERFEDVRRRDGCELRSASLASFGAIVGSRRAWPSRARARCRTCACFRA